MDERYDPKTIETKWQGIWADANLFKVQMDLPIHPVRYIWGM